MNLEQLREPLTTDQIDFRVQSINKGGYATILAYKDARVDMQRLDDVVGPLKWKREHLHSNHNCVVSIWDDDTDQWVSKEDTGTQSNTEAAKGLASDSFKRACFNWGIGRELYDYPVIQVKLKDNEWELNNGKPRQTYNLRIREWKWVSEWRDGELVMLTAMDGDEARYKYNGEFSGAYTPDQAREFKELVAEDDCLGLLTFIHKIGREAEEGIYNSAPHGEKGTFKDTVNAVKLAGETMVRGYVEQVRALAEQRDFPGIKQLLDELKANRGLVWLALSEIEQVHIQKLQREHEEQAA